MDNTARIRETAAEIQSQLQALPTRNTPSVRAVMRAFSRALRREDGHFVVQIAKVLRREHGYWSVAYELIAAHQGAFRLLGEREFEELGRGLDSWWSVDSFARTLSGPAWRERLVGDGLIDKWARSSDKWWRRAALVSTVALNVRSRGGKGDVPRTLKICMLLVDDHEDMIEKALSWALRELVVHDAQAIRDFVDKCEARLGSRVKREVHNKLRTGLKSPKRKACQRVQLLVFGRENACPNVLSRERSITMIRRRVHRLDRHGGHKVSRLPGACFGVGSVQRSS